MPIVCWDKGTWAVLSSWCSCQPPVLHMERICCKTPGVWLCPVPRRGKAGIWCLEVKQGLRWVTVHKPQGIVPAWTHTWAHTVTHWLPTRFSGPLQVNSNWTQLGLYFSWVLKLNRRWAWTSKLAEQRPCWRMNWFPWGNEKGSSSSAASRTGACPWSQLQVLSRLALAALWPLQGSAVWSLQVPRPWEPQRNCRIPITLQGWSRPTDTWLGSGPAEALEKKPLRQVLCQCSGQDGCCRWGRPLCPWTLLSFSQWWLFHTGCCSLISCLTGFL